MIEWLTDTLAMTGVLMGLVLMVRGAVGRWFGAGAAYALWALPMIRLVLPPLALPRGLLPQYHVGLEKVTASATAPVEIAASPAVAIMPPAKAVAGIAIEPDVIAQVPWAAILIFVWLGGAALFLIWRAVSYHAMRRELLRGARQVAHSGAVRIIESPAAAAPLAFGVFDKVIALRLASWLRPIAKRRTWRLRMSWNTTPAAICWRSWRCSRCLRCTGSILWLGLPGGPCAVIRRPPAMRA